MCFLCFLPMAPARPGRAAVAAVAAGGKRGRAAAAPPGGPEVPRRMRRGGRGGALGAGERGERAGAALSGSPGSRGRFQPCTARAEGCGLRRAPSEPAALLTARCSPHSSPRSSQPTPLIRFREIHPCCPLQVQKLTFRWKLRLPISSLEFNSIFVEAFTVSTTLP